MFEPLRPVIRALVESFSSAWGLDHPSECSRDLADRLADLLAETAREHDDALREALARVRTQWAEVLRALEATARIVADARDAEHAARVAAEARCAELERVAEAARAERAALTALGQAEPGPQLEAAMSALVAAREAFSAALDALPPQPAESPAGEEG